MSPIWKPLLETLLDVPKIYELPHVSVKAQRGDGELHVWLYGGKGHGFVHAWHVPEESVLEDPSRFLETVRDAAMGWEKKLAPTEWAPLVRSKPAGKWRLFSRP